MERQGIGMNSAGIASLCLILIGSVAAPSAANSRMTPREAESKQASQSRLKPDGAGSFALNAAATIGARWGIVTSTHRTRERNRLVGGARNSFHLTGRAIDVARRPGVTHADIEASYRKAGFVLIESLDEGDHSHFAFGALRSASADPLRLELRRATKSAASGCNATAKTYIAVLQRRRPDRAEDCAPAEEPQAVREVAEVAAAAFE